MVPVEQLCSASRSRLKRAHSIDPSSCYRAPRGRSVLSLRLRLSGSRFRPRVVMPVLQEAQQGDLSLRRQRINFVQEERASLGLFNQPRMPTEGACMPPVHGRTARFPPTHLVRLRN